MKLVSLYSTITMMHGPINKILETVNKLKLLYAFRSVVLV